MCIYKLLSTYEIYSDSTDVTFCVRVILKNIKDNDVQFGLNKKSA